MHDIFGAEIIDVFDLKEEEEQGQKKKKNKKRALYRFGRALFYIKNPIKREVIKCSIC